MRIVELVDGVSINPEYVASVTVNSAYQTITIRMADGREHHIDRDYGKSAWQTHDRVLKMLTEDE